jgi:hypothetical protein
MIQGAAGASRSLLDRQRAARLGDQTSEDDSMAKKKDKGKVKVEKVTAHRYRDAATGRFVTRKYAKKNRGTTVKEARATA